MSDHSDPSGDATAASDAPAPAEGAAAAYRVLARKYRPRDFSQLIGQDALVRTLSNAIQTRRLAHAFILTGVRGVGKTTTARIIAKALNYIGPDGTGEPTTGPTDDCPLCRAIAEDRHPDVIELDAASRTSVDDIREIIDSVRYGPVEARYKIFIIDEVHMLSRNAFNALLKTLEEPPEHVKFIFATTEIRKVPVTVLSRCQRFDLRRVEQPVLAAHFTRIVEQEKGAAEEEAIAMIARAADGSVRDGLSLLDQALVLGDGRVEAEAVRRMLGLADRSALIGLFEALVGGDPPLLLDRLDGMHAYGADPVVVLQDMLDFTHFLTRLKLVPGLQDDPAVPEMERKAGLSLVADLGMAVLARLWQMLMKGLGEVQQAPNPQTALEMVLLRAMHGAHLPSPGDLMARLDKIEGAAAGGGSPSGGGGAAGGGGGAGGATAMATGATGGGSVRQAVAGRPAPQAVGGGSAPQAWAGPAPEAARARGETARAAPGLTLAVDNTVPRGQAEPVAEDTPAVPVAADALPRPERFEAAVDLFDTMGQHKLAATLKTAARLVSFEEGHIVLNLAATVPQSLPQTVAAHLTEWTGRRWAVTVSEATGDPSLVQQARDARAAEIEAARSLPLVAAALETFPGAEIVDVRTIAVDPAELPGGAVPGADLPALDESGYAHDDVVGEEDDADPFVP